MFRKSHHSISLQTTKISFTCAAFSLIFAYQAHAASIYYGYSQSDQTTPVGNNSLDFTPAGSSLLISLDPTENINVYAEFSALDDTQSINEQASGTLDLESLSVGIGYYLDNWSFSASYLDWQDELLVDTIETSRRVATDVTVADTFALSVSYDKTFESWQLGANIGLHYSDWQLDSQLLTRDSEGKIRNQTSVDMGSSLFVSVGLSAAHYHSLSGASGIMFGGNIGWNHLTDSESEAVSRNGRNISQIANRTIRNLITTQNILGSESYGQASLFISYDISEHWVTDLNFAYDFGTEVSSPAWSVNLGYQF